MSWQQDERSQKKENEVNEEHGFSERTNGKEKKVEKRRKVFMENIGLKYNWVDLNMNEKNHLEIFRCVNVGRENNWRYVGNNFYILKYIKLIFHCKNKLYQQFR